MTTPRSQLVDQTTPLYYHIVSRCVRRAWLCGKDPINRKNYSHRKEWLKQRMFHLARHFSIEINAFTILSNHFHLVLYFDPMHCTKWSDDEVASRWVEAFPPKGAAEKLALLKENQKKAMLEDKVQLEARRRQLGSLSFFMKHLKQPIAYRANKEDDYQGHFFESRFYSGALLTEKAVLACMAYVDLNPVRAKIARSLKQCLDSSIRMRLKQIEGSLEKLKEVLKPLASGLGETTQRLSVTLKDYLAYLQERIALETGGPYVQSKAHIWFAQTASFKRKQRAYGPLKALNQWNKKQGFKRPEPRLPE